MVVYEVDMDSLLNALGKAIEMSGLRRNYICRYIGSHKDRIDNLLKGNSLIRFKEGLILCRLFGINPMDYITSRKMEESDAICKRSDSSGAAISDPTDDSKMV